MSCGAVWGSCIDVDELRTWMGMRLRIDFELHEDEHEVGAYYLDS